MADFETPDFLRDTVETIHERMLSVLPSHIDSSEGGFAWDYTRPNALEIARFIQFNLYSSIQMILPVFASGEWLSYHAQTRGLSRRAATQATGEITVTGRQGAVIPQGSLFSTVTVGEQLSVDFETTQPGEIPESGTLTIPVRCTQSGTVGNVPAGTIVLIASSLPGVNTVTNGSACSGGTETEDDESLRARILEYDRGQGESFVGNMADYKRWAMSVPGVGAAIVIPAQDDSGLVTIVVTDSNGAPATEELCQDVYDYIMRPDAPEERPAPINALLLVKPPESLQITISATVEFLDGFSEETVKESFQKSVTAYFGDAPDDGEIKYTRIAALLSAVEGVNDFKNLLLDGGTKNISVAVTEIPILSDIVFTSGEVS